MSEFKLDTSGIVDFHVGSLNSFRMWKDLSPFEQGYVEALLRFANDHLGDVHSNQYGFSDLAPETLAQIREDCTVMEDEKKWLNKIEDGYWFWTSRQIGNLSYMPPLTLYLSDDGKLHFR